MLSATQNSPMFAILTIAIALATPAITESTLASNHRNKYCWYIR